MAPRFNYRHLYYFWVVATEGGLSRAAARLGMAVQTVGTQVRELERDLGLQLLRPAGRGLALTEAGSAVARRAEQIFQLGESLPELAHAASAAPVVRLVVGVAEGMPKLVAHRLIGRAGAEPRLRLLCHEDHFETLLAELALHRLDIVIADRSAPPGPTLRLYSHALETSPVGWYAAPALAAAARRDFPASLQRVPVLLPTAQSAMRPRLDAWFERHGLRPRVVGEFEDSALLKTFGAGGMGAFPAADCVQRDLTGRYRVRRIGDCDGVQESWFAIGTEKKVQHPLVQRLLAADR